MAFARPDDRGDVSVPLQLPSLHCGQETTIMHDGMLGPVADLGVGDKVRVGDTQDLSTASHFRGLHSSL